MFHYSFHPILNRQQSAYTICHSGVLKILMFHPGLSGSSTTIFFLLSHLIPLLPVSLHDTYNRLPGLLLFVCQSIQPPGGYQITFVHDSPYKSLAHEPENNPFSAVGTSCSGGTVSGSVATPRGRKLVGLGGKAM